MVKIHSDAKLQKHVVDTELQDDITTIESRKNEPTESLAVFISKLKKIT